NDTATPEIYTLSLHDALPIWSIGTFVLARRARKPGSETGKPGLVARARRVWRLPRRRARGEGERHLRLRPDRRALRRNQRDVQALSGPGVSRFAASARCAAATNQLRSSAAARSRSASSQI